MEQLKTIASVFIQVGTWLFECFYQIADFRLGGNLAPILLIGIIALIIYTIIWIYYAFKA